MIIIDLNQIIISNIMAQVGKYTNVQIEIGLIRHMVLNQIRYLKTKFQGVYGGNIVVATDGRHYWRKDIFPYYKVNRSKARKESDFDWPALFECLNTIRDEIKVHMPYPVIHHDKAEADDVIGTLVTKVGVELMNQDTELVLIVSGDGDFAQLQRFANVSQYDPIRDRWIKTNDAVAYLREHIIRGDTGDGIPNILSPDNSLADGIRQKKCTQKVLDTWMGLDESSVDDANYKRNRTLIDLTQVPEWLQVEILEQYEQQKGKDRHKVFNYFVQSKLVNLLNSIQEF